MRYEYFKIIDPAFVQSLLDGNLYMNSLNYFRALEEGTQKEGNKAQKDPMEGVCGTIPKNRLRQVGFHFSEDLLEVMDNHVPLLSENYGYNNLFCLYRLQIDEDAKTIQQPSRQLINFNDKDNAQKVVIWFRDSEAFLRRLETALQTALTGQTLEYAIMEVSLTKTLGPAPMVLAPVPPSIRTFLMLIRKSGGCAFSAGDGWMRLFPSLLGI